MKLLYVIAFIILLFCFTRSACPPGQFNLPEMNICHPFLTCSELNNMKIVKRIGSGAVKDVFLANWKSSSVVLSVPANANYIKDFLSGVEVLKLLNPSKQIVQFLGYCEEKHVLFTEYHPIGNASHYFEKMISNHLNVLESLQFCHQYSLILNHVHNGPAGRRVFCDSNNLDKLLSQLLITYDLRLVLNDVDALPQITDDSGIKCGHRQLTGTFVAPEQLWSQSSEFDDKLLKGYNEKTDIWKAASVCNFFLNKAVDGDIAWYSLFELHNRCKSLKPTLRPTATELVQSYSSAIREFSNHFEL